MAESSNSPPAPVTSIRGRNSGVIRARLKEAKLVHVDSAMEKGESWAKKILSGDTGVLLDDIEPFLKALGLKAVGIDRVCVDRATAQAYETIAKRAMATETTLLGDDAE